MPSQKTAIWALTPGAVRLGKRIAEVLPGSTLLCSEMPGEDGGAAKVFSGFSETLSRDFHRYSAHVFVMATGIVVRMIAPLLRGKTRDPAVVVMDEKGFHAISLLSGHIGGANKLALELASRLGAEPVITTATDINGVPAIDVIAMEQDLRIENPEAVRSVSMALLKGESVWLHDPYNALGTSTPGLDRIQPASMEILLHRTDGRPSTGVVVDDIRIDLPPGILVLRPGSLVAGMGCNRDTRADEMEALLQMTLETYCLAPSSLAAIATVDIKAREKGLLELSRRLGIQMLFFSREALQSVSGIRSHSETVQKHIGVSNVCEAAAILGAKSGNLVVPKQKTPNATLAIARKSSL